MVSKKEISFIELVGWYGTFSVISSYILISFHVLSVNNLLYQLLNLTGAVSIVAVCYVKKTYQPLVVNVIWGVIALFTVSITFFNYFGVIR